ncbi:hypothetical protein GTR02_04280 [Kineococcus sp. R8]|uniref:hypothetical protein n=1 Tax=Kineococcus siccus TaxID=2696567 RepID=UPI001411F53D|nr:hypothetical protein [Kineococcus siccus]NAZ81032.1 hypothetical protein [Kineococcus siccus]
MSAELASAEVTYRLARLSLRSSAVGPTSRDVDAALHGRAATFALARQMLEDVGGRTPTRGVALREGMVSARLGLQIALRDTSAPIARESPLDVHVSSRPGSLAREWEAIGGLATEAHRHWTSAADRPRGDSGRAAGGDAAVLVLSAVNLDDALRRAARDAGRQDVAEALEPGASGALSFHAERLMRWSPTGDWSATARPRLSDLPVIPVSGTPSLHAGLRRLNDQLDAGAAVSPQHVALLLSAQVRMSLFVAEGARTSARTAGDPRLVTASRVLSDHAQRLAEVWSRDDNNLRSLLSTDPRPALQAGECWRYLQGRPHTPPADIERLTRDIKGLVPPLQRAVDRQVRAGAWVTTSIVEDLQGRHAWRAARDLYAPQLKRALSAFVVTMSGDASRRRAPSNASVINASRLVSQ